MDPLIEPIQDNATAIEMMNAQGPRTRSPQVYKKTNIKQPGAELTIGLEKTNNKQPGAELTIGLEQTNNKQQGLRLFISDIN